MELDYTLETPQERNQLVKKIIESTPQENLTHKYLQILANYIIFAMTKEERKSRSINTDNRMVTINKRETSFEGLTAKMQNGENGIYSLIIENDKNLILTPKTSITQDDIASIPQLRQLREAIADLKKQLIQMRQDQYVIKMGFKQPIFCLNAVKNFFTMSFQDSITVNHDGSITDKSLVSFFNPSHISALLCNYSRLKENCYGKFYTDGYYMMQALDELVERTLKNVYPFYFKLLVYKIDGLTNAEIQQKLGEQFGYTHSVQYLSSLWRKKIPKLLAEAAQKQYLIWYYTNKERGRWKKCSRCGEVKLAHNHFFSKNTSSKDGFYSICKCCRNAKTLDKKESNIIKKIPFIKEEK